MNSSIAVAPAAPTAPQGVSLRIRLAATFAAFGALVSLLLSAGLFVIVHAQGIRLMDETLNAEIEDMMARLARNPAALPPSTVSVRGYVIAHAARGAPTDHLQLTLLDLPVAQKQLSLGGIPYRIAVADKDGKRYVMLFNELAQRQSEAQIWRYWIAGTVFMTLLSGVIGWWLSGRIVHPVAELARRVSTARLDDASGTVAHGFSGDEIGMLARVFDGYLERMRAFSRRERAFTADVSHELRTPLAVIQGAVELLEGDARLDERQRDRLARIGRAARQMTDLTHSLLLMAREGSPREPLHKDCDVWEVLRETVDSHRYLASSRTTLSVSDDAHPHLAAERTLLGVVVANLIRNALTYTDAGSVSVRLAADRLTVADTGSGIPGEDIDKVFDRYFKGSDSTGEGIGLSLVKRICERYGWQILIDSVPGRGTTAQLIFASSPEAAHFAS